MAGNATIGALRVDLGLNSASFTKGLRESQSALAGFGKAAAIGLAAVATAAVAVGAALGVAVKHAIDHADELNKLSQKAGLSVEALSRLEYAARFSDVSLEGLTGSLGKLSKSMIEAAQNSKSGPATAFNALGISVKDSAGRIRSTDAVFADLADRFSKLPDGAVKTSLAMALLGKSGAEMIPLLNGGATELKRLSDEADRLHKTISTKTARAAEEFNDTLTKISGTFEGVTNQIMEAALPALQGIADIFADPKFQQSVTDLGTALITAFKEFLPYLQNAMNNLVAIHDIFADFENKSKIGQRNAIVDVQNQITTLENNIDANKKKLADGGLGTLFGANDPSLKTTIADDIAAVQPLIDKMSQMQRVLNGTADMSTDPRLSTKPSTFNFRNALDPTKQSSGIDLNKYFRDTSGDSAAAAEAKKLKSEGESIRKSMLTNLEAYQESLGHLSDLYHAGAINQDTYGRAVAAAQDNFTGLTSTMQTLGGSIAGLIKGTSSLSDVLLNVASKLISGIDFKSMGAGGGLLQGLLGGLVSGGFADGVASAPRGLAWVGERGPELMNFRGGESVTPMSQNVNVTVSVDKSGNLQAFVNRVAGAHSAQAGAIAVETARRSMPEWQQNMATTGTP